MTRQISAITKLKWPAWLALLLIFAACATSAPPGNLSSVQQDSLPTPLPRQASKVAEASTPLGEPPAETDLTTPVNVPATTAFTLSPQVPPTETTSDSPKLAVPTLIAEATAVTVVSTTAPVPTVMPALAPTSITLAIPPAVTPVPVAVVPPAAQLPTATSLPLPTLSLRQDTEAKLGKERSAEEATPVPTAAVASIEPTKTPIPDPTPAIVSPPAPAVDTDAAAVSARSFVLPSAQGKQVSLDDYLDRGNVVLIFYRAFWWVYCRAQLMELQGDYDLIKSLEADILAISTDDLSGAAYAVDGLGLEFPILYDPEALVVKEYGVYDLLGDGMAAPATFLLDRTGKVQWQYVGKRINDRPSNQEIVSRLMELAEG